MLADGRRVAQAWVLCLGRASTHKQRSASDAAHRVIARPAQRAVAISADGRTRYRAAINRAVCIAPLCFRVLAATRALFLGGKQALGLFEDGGGEAFPLGPRLTFMPGIAASADKIGLNPERMPGAKQIADAAYDSLTGRLHLTFRDGTTAETSPRP
jgi:hypothetical protein